MSELKSHRSELIRFFIYYSSLVTNVRKKSCKGGGLNYRVSRHQLVFHSFIARQWNGNITRTKKEQRKQRRRNNDSSDSNNNNNKKKEEQEQERQRRRRRRRQQQEEQEQEQEQKHIVYVHFQFGNLFGKTYPKSARVVFGLNIICGPLMFKGGC